MSKNTSEHWNVRSQADLKGYVDPEPEYVDVETGEIKTGYPPSKTDSSQWESMESLIKRITRGEMVTGGITAGYDGVPGQDPNEIIANMDPSRKSGFDLADAARLQREANQTITEEMGKKRKLDDEEAARVKKQRDDDAAELARRREAERAAGAPEGRGRRPNHEST